MKSEEIGREKVETDGDHQPAGLEKQGKFKIHLVNDFEEQQHLNSEVSILIVDSKVSLVEEPNNGDKKINISDGDLTLATYSNSESTLLAYISIFEILSGLKLI
jgi:hypothetical protein